LVNEASILQLCAFQADDDGFNNIVHYRLVPAK
jgi:hypothetical protein